MFDNRTTGNAKRGEIVAPRSGGSPVCYYASGELARKVWNLIETVSDHKLEAIVKRKQQEQQIVLDALAKS